MSVNRIAKTTYSLDGGSPFFKDQYVETSLHPKHRHLAETMIGHLQEGSRAAVLAKPQAGRGAVHPVWGGPGWKVYLDCREDMVRTVDYIGQNPSKAGRSVQRWPFVKPYDGWLPGQVRLVRRLDSLPEPPISGYHGGHG